MAIYVTNAKRVTDECVYLTSEYTVHRWELDPGDFYLGVHIVRTRCVSGDFDIVETPWRHSCREGNSRLLIGAV